MRGVHFGHGVDTALLSPPALVPEEPMITVYGAFPTRSIRVMWALEELGKDYELRPVDLRNRMADVEFLALNPSGFLPVMQDGDVAMVDSIAILEYLIARYDNGLLAPAGNDPHFPDYQ